MSHIVVVGAGISGLFAAHRLISAGHEVTLIAKGIGGLQLSGGTVDILGYAPGLVHAPLEALPAFAAAHPEHPYALVADSVAEAVTQFANVVGPTLLTGDVTRNVCLPTAVGALRPTSLAAPSMMSGALQPGDNVVVVGLRRNKDFYPDLIAGNLARQGIDARAANVDVEFRAGETDTSGLNIARALDDPAVQDRLVAALRPHVHDGEVVALPAVLGIKNPHAWDEVQAKLGHPVFEIPLPPPGVPGMRLNERLTRLVKGARARYMLGSKVTGGIRDGERLGAVSVGTAGSPRLIEADAFVVATGGFESGALHMDSRQQITETALDLPVWSPGGELFSPTVGAQAAFDAGVRVDADMRVLDDAGEPVYTNVFAAGSILRGSQPWREKSGEGIALASAYVATQAIEKEWA